MSEFLDQLVEKSLSTNGYQKFPGGLVVQWGNTTVNAGATETVTLPIEMPTAIRSASVTANSSGAVYGTVLSFTKTTFNIKNPTATNAAFFWIVIGY